MKNAVVGIIMGSESDLDVMSEAAKVFDEFEVPYETRVISAHRTPDVMATYANGAADRGLKVIIAGAGGSAHLPGMTASHTPLPVLAVPVKRDSHDHEALWSNVKMPPGVPLATMPENGAKNAALMATEILALTDAELASRYEAFRQKQHENVLAADAQLQTEGWQNFQRN
ncbi:5-(carboxyamino)imidazole ribonucleotide mutase [Candidatus Saccharibacteria bacterium]|nr:MAG: 5-(carboxyamino)imidazole ribonucleotide mutase [Candidatus Saccharibacteria bacterium]